MERIEQATTVGKFVVKKFFDYYKDASLDDETEFFPVLKVIISGVADSFENRSQKNEIERELMEYSKQLYVSFWLLQSEENEEHMDAEHEKAEAVSNFEKLYKMR